MIMSLIDVAGVDTITAKWAAEVLQSSAARAAGVPRAIVGTMPAMSIVRRVNDLFLSMQKIEVFLSNFRRPKKLSSLTCMPLGLKPLSKRLCLKPQMLHIFHGLFWTGVKLVKSIVM